MSPIHDSWQTIEDEHSVRIMHKKDAVESHEEPSKQEIPAASRKPAAVIGVMLTVSIGFLILHGLGGILGQVSVPDPLTIRLTPSGAMPLSLTVRPGETVTWINEDTIPHVLSSETLLDETGEPLETSALFPQSTLETIIPASTLEGTYDYISKTAMHITGEIVVETSVPAAPQPATTPVTTTQSASSASAVPVAQAPQPTDPTGDVPTDIPAYAASIPVNPHTVGSPDVPLPPRAGATTTASTIIDTHTPRSNAETGPAIWITGIASIGLLLFVTRRSFKRA